MVFSSSNQGNDKLGDILLKEGKINLEQYNQSVELLKEAGGSRALCSSGSAISSRRNSYGQ